MLSCPESLSWAEKLPDFYEKRNVVTFPPPPQNAPPNHNQGHLNSNDTLVSFSIKINKIFLPKPVSLYQICMHMRNEKRVKAFIPEDIENF